MLKPTPAFYYADAARIQTGFRFAIVQLPPAIVLGPFSRHQTIVDEGIRHRDVGIIYVMLFAQLMLSVGQTANGLIQNLSMPTLLHA
jgi:hypothetical protein